MRGVTALLAVWLICCAVHQPDTRPRVTFTYSGSTHP
jgi:hypothetical protein